MIRNSICSIPRKPCTPSIIRRCMPVKPNSVKVSLIYELAFSFCLFLCWILPKIICAIVYNATSKSIAPHFVKYFGCRTFAESSVIFSRNFNGNFRFPKHFFLKKTLWRANSKTILIVFALHWSLRASDNVIQRLLKDNSIYPTTIYSCRL